MFKLFSQKAFNDIVPFHRALLTVNNKGTVYTVPLKKIVAVGFGVDDVISIDEWQLLVSNKLDYINAELLSDDEFKMDYDKFIELCKSKIFTDNIFLMRVVRKQYHNNLLIVVAEVFDEEKPKAIERSDVNYQPD